MWTKTSLKGKTIVVTGATSGIGRAIAVACAAEGACLVICGRRQERLAELTGELMAAGASSVWARALDVRSHQAVLDWWAELPDGFKPARVLVNNAGLARGLSNLRDNQVADWDEMVDTNIKGLLYVTQAVLPDLLKAPSAHIVNIGSLAGIAAYPQAAVYCATKAAVRTFSDGLRLDLVDTAVRVTNIQPGMVETEFSLVRFRGDGEKAGKVYQGIDPLVGEDVAEAVLFALTAPEHVQIAELTLMPTHQASVGVVFRK